jgi:hypothetical protein
MGKPKVPNTVSDRKMADLRRKAEKASTGSMFSRKAVDQRLAGNKQRSKSKWS